MQGFGETYWEVVDATIEVIYMTFHSKKKAEEMAEKCKKQNIDVVIRERRI